MDVEERLALIRQVATEGEIVTEEELRALLAEKARPIAYDGFEPSGRIHIAQGVLRAINVNKMTKAGCLFKMFVADWHAWANNKMGGDLERIQTTGRYFVEVWRAAGMDLDNVEFVWASDFVTDESYWKTVMNVARDSSLDRILRTTQIMGRSEKDKLSASQILYPCMQAADIFHLKADITQLGMDQRKVNMLAREVGPKLGFWKPVVVSHHMLMGLQAPPGPHDYREDLNYILFAFTPMPNNFADLLDPAKSIVAGLDEAWAARRGAPMRALNYPDVARSIKAANTAAKDALSAPGANSERLNEQLVWVVEKTADALRRVEQMARADITRTIERATAMKMSKSNPDSAIFMTDTPEDVNRKLKKAYCPEKQVAENPVLEYMRYLVFERFPEVVVERPEKFGGNVTFHGYAELEKAFAEGALHPMDLKKATAGYVNKLLDPVRAHFEKDEKARALKEQVESFQVTR